MPPEAFIPKPFSMSFSIAAASLSCIAIAVLNTATDVVFPAAVAALLTCC